ncbi:MAG: SDR family NAD(P)-dependent oxidoreductase [Bradyrhizobiaceae bacterium]|nr:SDR family NAD(P)-dependent oxidoreductase [Bradyrhizobiaceae bacterium]
MKAVLVTGANGALGSVVCRHLLTEGWDVIAVDRHNADVLDAKAMKSFVGTLDMDVVGLVHTVGGITAGTPVQEMDASDMQQQLQLNMMSAFNVVHAVLPGMIRAGGGSIVTIGAKDVLHPMPNRTAYAASKAALVAFTRSLAEEGKATNVRANVIIPSIIATAANMEWGSAEDVATWVTPEQVANTIAMLLDPASAVSGALIPMYGKVGF